MENFSQTESDILSKIKNINDRKSYESIKTEIFGKKGIITELFKKIGSLDQSQRKDFASKLNFLKTKATVCSDIPFSIASVLKSLSHTLNSSFVEAFV